MDLTCHICSESYTTVGLRRPHSLPCSHTMCGICTARLLNNGVMLCPVCKQSYEYKKVEEITINRELVKVIEFQLTINQELGKVIEFPESKSATEESTIPQPGLYPKEVPVSTGPSLHHGVCDEHDAYRVHYCVTHAKYICADCAVAYHMDENCKRVPIKTRINEKKRDLCENLDSQLNSLQNTGSQIDDFQNVCKGVELHHKITKEKLQADLKELEKQINRLEKQIDGCQISESKYLALKKDCENKEKEAKFSKDNIQSVATFTGLGIERQHVESSEFNTKKWTNQVEDGLKQSIEEIFTPDALATIIKSQDTYASYTHNGEKRWGHIKTWKGYTLMQDFRTEKPPTGALVLNLKDVTEHLSSPRHVYLSFSHRWSSRHLGTVIIRVNEEAPVYAHQLIDLCIGHTGARYSGSTAIASQDFNLGTERLNFDYYLTKDNKKSNEKLFPDLEQGGKVPHVKGKVVILNKKCADFRILTKDDYRDGMTWDGPEIGQVVSGLPVLEQITKNKLVAGYFSSLSKVTISECGLVIDFRNQ